MDCVGAKRRSQRGDQFLRQGSWRRRFFFVAASEKAVAHADAELSRTGNLQRQFMKCAPASPGIERRTVGTVANQIIALLIFHHAADSAAQIVRVSNRNASRLSREIVKTLLCFKCSPAPIA